LWQKFLLFHRSETFSLFYLRETQCSIAVKHLPKIQRLLFRCRIRWQYFSPKFLTGHAAERLPAILILCPPILFFHYTKFPRHFPQKGSKRFRSVGRFYLSYLTIFTATLIDFAKLPNYFYYTVNRFCLSGLTIFIAQFSRFSAGCQWHFFNIFLSYLTITYFEVTQ
jgi:hypothetical protein